MLAITGIAATVAASLPLKPVAPRRNPLLPFVKPDKNGRLTYERRIPQQLRRFLGGKASIRRTLDATSTDIGSTSVLTAYSAVHSEVERQLAEAKQQLKRTDRSIAQAPEQIPLSPKDIAGISAEPLRQMADALQNGRISGADPEQLKESVAQFLAQVVFTNVTGNRQQVQPAFEGLTAAVLENLDISASSQDQRRIIQQMLRYAPDAKGDIERTQQGDFSAGELKRKAPALPKRQLSWLQLMEMWRLNTGGVLEADGYGVSEQRDGPYRRAIAAFTEVIGDVWPNEVDESQARKFVRWLREASGLATRTQQDRLGCLKNLMKVGRQEGAVKTNPFDGLTISTPAGVDDEQGYRPFSKDEVIKIFALLKGETQQVKQIIHYILLCQGCRLSEALQLRTHDIKQTATGIWYIDWRHEPTAAHPMLLKTKAKNNRQCPLHPRLIEQGFLDIPRNHEGRLFNEAPLGSTTYSNWFKQRLKKLGMWEAKKTVLHSLRGTARDLQREAGVAQEFRNAITGHQSKEIGERHYGVGLAAMPGKVFEQLQRVDLSWLP